MGGCHLSDVTVLKRASDTRWSARADATKALSKGYICFQEALKLISGDVNHRANTCYEAKAVLKQLSKLETVLLADFWAVILDRFNQVNKSLQHETLELQSAIKLLTSLQEFLMSLRNQFKVFENKAKTKVETTNYHDEQKTA